MDSTKENVCASAAYGTLNRLVSNKITVKCTYGVPFFQPPLMSTSRIRDRADSALRGLYENDILLTSEALRTSSSQRQCSPPFRLLLQIILPLRRHPQRFARLHLWLLAMD